MLITISLLILAYVIMGKDIKSLLERVKNIDWRGKINALMDKLRPWAISSWASWTMAWQCSSFTRRLRIRLPLKSMQRLRIRSTSGLVSSMN